LRRYLQAHTVDTLAEKVWPDKDNGALLDLAERGDYEVFVTTDQIIRYQQNLTGERSESLSCLARCPSPHP